MNDSPLTFRPSSRESDSSDGAQLRRPSGAVAGFVASQTPVNGGTRAEMVSPLLNASSTFLHNRLEKLIMLERSVEQKRNSELDNRLQQTVKELRYRNDFLQKQNARLKKELAAQNQTLLDLSSSFELEVQKYVSELSSLQDTLLDARQSRQLEQTGVQAQPARRRTTAAAADFSLPARRRQRSAESFSLQVARGTGRRGESLEQRINIRGPLASLPACVNAAPPGRSTPRSAAFADPLLRSHALQSVQASRWHANSAPLSERRSARALAAARFPVPPNEPAQASLLQNIRKWLA